MTDHPEFFRLKDGLAILVWRRSYDKSFDPDAGKAYTAEELERLEALPEEQQPSLTRQALTPDQITALIDSAIKIHAAAIAYSQELRWRVPVLAGILVSFLGPSSMATERPNSSIERTCPGKPENASHLKRWPTHSTDVR